MTEDQLEALCQLTSKSQAKQQTEARYEAGLAENEDLANP